MSIMNEERKMPLPCKTEVDKYLSKWDSLENYVIYDSYVDKVLNYLRRQDNFF